MFSLGVVLYELLTGTTPLTSERIRSAAFDEIRRIIREEEPEKPSIRITKLSSAKSMISNRRPPDIRFKQSISAELDWIAMRCLEKDRTRRYQAASDLADDILRHLKGETVEACPPTLGYRLGKLATRYRVQVSVAAAFLSLLVISTTVAWGLFLSARRARNEAMVATTEERAARQEAESTNVQLKEQRNIAEDRRAEADDLRANMERSLYDSNVAQAARLVDEENYLTAQQLLDECPDEVKNWEWHRLQSVCSLTKQVHVAEEIDSFHVDSHSGQVAVIDASGELHLLDGEGKTVWTRSTDVPHQAIVSFSPDGNLISVTSSPTSQKLPSRMELWNMEGERQWERDYEEGFLWMPAISWGNQYLAVPSIVAVGRPIYREGHLELIDLRTKKRIWKTSFGGLPVAFFSRDSQNLLINEARGFSGSTILQSWKVAGPELNWKQGYVCVSQPAPTADDDLSAIGGPNHEISICSLRTGETVQVVGGGMPDEAFSVTFSSDGNYASSFGTQGHVAIGI